MASVPQACLLHCAPASPLAPTASLSTPALGRTQMDASAAAQRTLVEACPMSGEMQRSVLNSVAVTRTVPAAPSKMAVVGAAVVAIPETPQDRTMLLQGESARHGAMGQSPVTQVAPVEAFGDFLEPW